MPDKLEILTRHWQDDGYERVIVRPGIALTLYSVEKLGAVMAAAAEALKAYLAFVPPGAIQAIYEPPPDEDSPDAFVPFDSAEAGRLLRQLQAGQPSPEDDYFCFELTGTPDGQAGDYAVSFAGVNTTQLDEDDTETSLLRFELPWTMLDTMDAAELVAFFIRIAALFPYCSGNAGMSFFHSAAFTAVAVDEIQKLLPRYLGFDSIYGAPYMDMRGKAPPAQWINFLGQQLVSKLGGEPALRIQLEGCPLERVGGGLSIRAAKYPPVADVNWQCPDIGLLPLVARTLQPVRLNSGIFTPMPNADSGQRWLVRFDALACGKWDNSP